MTSIIIALLLVIPVALYARREWEFEQAWEEHAVRYMLENADLRDKLARQIAREKWHKYPDEKPPNAGNYLITYDRSRHDIYCALWYCGMFSDDEGGVYDNTEVTYWRKLPAPPEEEK